MPTRIGRSTGDSATLRSFRLAKMSGAAFDVAHARFVVEHVLDPLAVVRGMARALKPGGRLILEDDGHDILRLWPEPSGLDRIWRAYMHTYDRAGNDPLIGHRLVSLLNQAGVAPVRNTWLFFGACAGQPDLLMAYTENLARILEGVRDPILDLGEMDGVAFDVTLANLRRMGWASGCCPVVCILMGRGPAARVTKSGSELVSGRNCKPVSYG